MISLDFQTLVDYLPCCPVLGQQEIHVIGKKETEGKGRQGEGRERKERTTIRFLKAKYSTLKRRVIKEVKSMNYVL